LPPFRKDILLEQKNQLDVTFCPPNLL